MTRSRYLLLAILLAPAASAAQELPRESVWCWYKVCGGPIFALEIKLDKTIIFKSEYPVCKEDRSGIPDWTWLKNLEFTFKPRRAIVWEAYRDSRDNIITPPNQIIKGSIWLSGCGEDDVELGLGFTSNDKVYMHTIYNANPRKRGRMEIEGGLVVLTYPIKHARRGTP
jgi:hypothetical protein